MPNTLLQPTYIYRKERPALVDPGWGGDAQSRHVPTKFALAGSGGRFRNPAHPGGGGEVRVSTPCTAPGTMVHATDDGACETGW